MSKQELQPNGQPRMGLWDAGLAGPRKAWASKYAKIVAVITIGMFTLMPLYVAAYYKQEENAYRVTVRIIDLDSQASPSSSTNPAVLGPAVIAAVENDARMKPSYHLGWQIESDLERFNLQGADGLPARGIDADEYAQSLVLDQTVFGAVVIHPNATSSLVTALQTGSSAYEPQGAMSFYYEEARNFYTTNQYLVWYTTAALASAAGQAAASFAARQVQNAASASGGFNFTTFSASIAPPDNIAPASTSLLTQPFSYSEFNLRPFDQLAGTASTTGGLIYLIILTFLSGLGVKQAFDPVSKFLSLGSELRARLLIPLLGYFWISLHYSFVTLAFQVSFTRKYGQIGFFLFWMLNWVTMTGLGYTMELVLFALGPMVFPFFLLFWVILNVCGVFVDLADMDHFFLLEHILPVFNAVDGAKSIIYGTKNHLGQNFGICLAWLFFSAAGIAVTTVYKRAQVAREARRARESEKQDGQ